MIDWRNWSRWERVAFIVLVLVAVLTRFYILGDRVMSHDESLHTKFSYYLYAGSGYRHNPMMHGPLLFHITALSYFLFGVNDFVARVPFALLGVALVLSPFLFRRWLGRGGAFIASLLLLISPSISYYNRYIREDTPNLLMAVLLLWAILCYLDEGKSRWLTALGVFFGLLYTTKETSYIYTLIYFVLLLAPFALHTLTATWERRQLFAPFLFLMALLLLCVGVYGVALLQGEVVEHALDAHTRVAETVVPLWGEIALVMALLLALAAVSVAFFGVGEATLRRMRLFDVLMLMGTLTLPLGAAVIIRMARVDMATLYSTLISGSLAALMGPQLWISAAILFVMSGAAVFLGLWWGGKRWLIAAGSGTAIFTVLYTTIFTNPLGLFSGVVGSLAYWMAQHGVQRGTQPGYYYMLLMPLYEYLPLLFSIFGAVGTIVYLLGAREPALAATEEARAEDLPAVEPELPSGDVVPVDGGKLFVDRFFPFFMLGWTLLSWFAYSYAGEKMPWLTVHIALPTIFLAAWWLGRVADGVDWRAWWSQQGWVLSVAFPLTLTGLGVFGGSAGRAIAALREGFASAGPTLAQLDPLWQMLGGLLGMGIALAALLWAARRLGQGQTLRVLTLTFAALLAVVTVRTMTRLNYINYDLATEFMVYAHGAPDVKIALRQIEDVSWRTTGAPRDVSVAYGEREYTIFSWYLVLFPNATYYGRTPDPVRLRESPVVIAGSPQWAAVDPILSPDYDYFSYKFLWWPIEDYRNMSWARIRGALTNPEMRRALWDIIWNRDYRRYAQLKGRTITLKEWPFRDEFRLYVRRDLAQQIWGYRLGATGAEPPRPYATPMPDPYANRVLPLSPTPVIALPVGAPRGLAVAPDGSIYVADSLNHRIWQLSQQGAVLNSWGGEGSGPGQFREPWDVAVDGEGHVYVADTWNHRLQKFTAQGEFVRSWGTVGQFMRGDPNGEGAFYGPRALEVGPDGYLYVADTGNKRVQVFDTDGRFLWDFGGAGRNPGQLNEPVGLGFTLMGDVVIADAWNQRIQVLLRMGTPVQQWSVPTWNVDNPEDKPYLAIDAAGRIAVTDSSRGRILVFDAQGTLVGTLGGDQTLQFPSGLAFTPEGQLLVSDAHAAKILRYRMTDLGD